MGKPEVHVGPQPCRRLRYEHRAEKMDFFKVVVLPALILGAIGGWAFLIKVAGEWVGAW